jgi:hypothetical protein
MVEDRVDHFLVAVDDVEDAVGKARFLHQLGEANGNARVALGRLQDEGVAAGDRHSEHPHRDHRRKVERRYAGADAERLAHRIDVDAGAGADGVLALQRLRDSAAKFDDLEPSLNVALGVGNDLAMLGAERVRQLVHVRFDQFLELEHDAGAALRVGRGPGGLGGFGGVDCALQLCRGAELHLCLHLALVRVEDVAGAAFGGIAFAGDEMVDLAQHQTGP